MLRRDESPRRRGRDVNAPRRPARARRYLEENARCKKEARLDFDRALGSCVDAAEGASELRAAERARGDRDRFLAQFPCLFFLPLASRHGADGGGTYYLPFSRRRRREPADVATKTNISRRRDMWAVSGPLSGI